MEEKQAGITALITAYARAYHATHDNPKIFDDFLADQLFSADEHTFFDRTLANLIQLVDPDFAATQPDQEAALARVMQIQNGPITLSRSRYTEECLDQAVHQGFQQYVILGAGFDTFAFRRPDLLSFIDVFEVDHPVTQAMKRERISQTGWTFPQRLHMIPLDFRQQQLGKTLQQYGFDCQKNTFFSWQGVTYYLDRETVYSTFQEIASTTSGKCSIVFDYMDAEVFDPEKVSPSIRLMQTITQQAGEPIKTGFVPQTIASEFEPFGFHLADNLTPSDIQSRYFQGRVDDYRANPQIYFAKADKVIE